MTDQIKDIPFLNLNQVNEPYHEEFKVVFNDILSSGIYIRGSYLKRFEESFANFCGVKHCIGTGNGLDALTLILKSYIALEKLKKGDEVIVAANTFIATILSVKEAGLSPVLVEPDNKTFTIDVTNVSKAITSKTKAIIPTHLYGQLAFVSEINAIADQHNLLVISDAAQAHGAQDHLGNVAGSLCDAASFSFYPAKNLGGLGDAGAITTNDIELANMARTLGNYGTSEKYIHDYPGVNSRLDDIQAGILHCKLKNLKKDTIKRREIARKYLSIINNPKITLPHWDGTDNHVFHLFVVRVQDREQFGTYLKECGIGYLIHYPIPPHKQRALPEFSLLSLPITEDIHREVVSIPLHPMLSDSEIKYIIETLNKY